MRLWVINLKKKKKPTKKLQELYVTGFKLQNAIQIKEEPINPARNIWKIQLLKLYNPSNSLAFPHSNYWGNCS